MVTNRLNGKASLVLSSMLVLATGFWGCGSNQAPGKDDGGNNWLDGCKGDGTRNLNVVGDPNRKLHAGDKTELVVIITEMCVGAIGGVAVEFEIVSNPGDSSLSAASAVTEGNGMASVTLTAGNTISDFMVQAKYSRDPKPVYFSITIKRTNRQLYEVGPKELNTFINETAELTVRLLDVDSNDPIREVAIGFSPVPASADVRMQPTEVSTNLSGLAKSTFLAGGTPTTYTVAAKGVRDQVGEVTFTVHVARRPECDENKLCDSGYVCVDGGCRPNESGKGCISSDECPKGFRCESKFCRPDGSLPDTCATSDQCPPGYFCMQPNCYPCAGSSTTDPKCQSSGECKEGSCPPGFTCDKGFCYPNNDKGVVIPELGGTWYTKHTFNIASALGDTGTTISNSIDKLNRAINYCEITGVGVVDAMLCKDVIQKYVPDWAYSVIDIVANISSILSELRAEGEISITHLNPRELVSGTEIWHKILVRYPNACCPDFGQSCTTKNDCPSNQVCYNMICCNPRLQPNYPDCAGIDITREDLQYGDVEWRVKPFTGKVRVDAGTLQYTLLTDPREIEVQFSKFAGLVVDILIQVFTGYDNLGDALTEIIDCQAIQDLITNLWSDMGLDQVVGSVPDVTITCELAKPTAPLIIGGFLNQLGVGWNLLKVGGWATITTQDTPPYGVKLGQPEHETTGNGKWEGTFKVVLDGTITGSWYGSR